jgi:predicted ArsR family transcriptional regulator
LARRRLDATPPREQEALPPERKAADARMEAIATALSDATRWRILLELGQGDALPVGELAKRTGRRPDAISKHMAHLLRAGLVERAFSTCYRLPEAMRPGPGEKTIDLGPCVLKLAALG